jgi:carbon-monoxide dehydrogenase large subunit
VPLFGTPVIRREDARLLTGGAQYVSNLDIPGVATVTYVTATTAHARITSIDVSATRAVPGVIDIVTAGDLDIGPPRLNDPSWPASMARPLLATDTVRFVGQAIVAIVTETREAGADAAAEVVVDYDPLPAVMTVEDAMTADVLLFPDAGTNLVSHQEGGSADVDTERSDVVVRATFRSHRVAPCPLETRGGASQWDDDGRLTHWSSCQGAHPVRDVLCGLYQLPPEQVRVIAPDVGGSFGAKGRPYPEETLLPFLARRVGRPVRWVPPRSQDMVGMAHSRAQVQHVALGGTRDGKIESLHLRLDVDCGAYPMSAPLQGRNTGVLSSGPYAIPAIKWEVDSYVINATPITAYRGAGRPEAAALLERAIELYARELGIDSLEVRRRNFVPPDAFPYTSATGLKYDSGEYERGLDVALTMAGIEDARKEQARRRATDDRVELGIGVSTFIDRTAGVPGSEFGAVTLRPDGTVLVRTGSSPYGQGHHTSWAMLVADRTGLPLDRIEVFHGDTDVVPRGGTTGGSRSVQRAGSAIAVATDNLVDMARSVAADLLEAAVDDVVLDVDSGGRFHVAGTAARWVGWDDLAVAAVENPLACEADVEGSPSFPFGAYVAIVDVDTDTGKVTVRRLVTVDDAGRILNPLLAEGQVHGGAAQGVAQALMEEFAYDADGNPLTGTFADYPIISAAELPSFESALVETPSPVNILGAKGIAESGTIGAPPAVQNAVIDALSPYGVSHVDMPCTPEKVWRALAESRDSM